MPATAADHLVARLVWDGGQDLHVPSEMGQAASGQLEGTVGDRLAELAGRTCYDSLGKGRSSIDYHKHIHEVRHYSVYEHPVMTVLLRADQGHTFDPTVFLNRPGVWVEQPTQGLRVTLNPRVILDWEQFGRDLSFERVALGHWASKTWPNICQFGISLDSHAERSIRDSSEVVVPVYDEECWITMFLGGSRGFSHELVRHGDFTAISQRSTRYVDEDGSPWVDHPLVVDFLANPDVPEDRHAAIEGVTSLVKEKARLAYAMVAAELQAWLTGRGVDKFTARKQSRGAARGYLGNALYTELVFSASVAQWKRMIRMRACAAADAEIRKVFVRALPELKRSRYGDRFNRFTTQPSPDGIGQIVTEA